MNCWFQHMVCLKAAPPSTQLEGISVDSSVALIFLTKVRDFCPGKKTKERQVVPCGGCPWQLQPTGLEMPGGLMLRTGATCFAQASHPLCVPDSGSRPAGWGCAVASPQIPAVDYLRQTSLLDFKQNPAPLAFLVLNNSSRVNITRHRPINQAFPGLAQQGT